MLKGRARAKTRPDIHLALMNNVATVNHTRKKARQIILAAKLHFLRMVKHTHPVTPPPYAESFYVDRAVYSDSRKRGVFVAGNNDPVAMLVEFGAHPRGGPTEVLGYRPLGHGIDAAAGEG